MTHSLCRNVRRYPLQTHIQLPFFFFRMAFPWNVAVDCCSKKLFIVTLPEEILISTLLHGRKWFHAAPSYEDADNDTFIKEKSTSIFRPSLSALPPPLSWLNFINQTHLSYSEFWGSKKWVKGGGGGRKGNFTSRAVAQRLFSVFSDVRMVFLDSILFGRRSRNCGNRIRKYETMSYEWFPT